MLVPTPRYWSGQERLVCLGKLWDRKRQIGNLLYRTQLIMMFLNCVLDVCFFLSMAFHWPRFLSSLSYTIHILSPVFFLSFSPSILTCHFKIVSFLAGKKAPLPCWLTHIPLFILSSLLLLFAFLVLLIHNLSLDRKQREGASVLMNNNRNWERERERGTEAAQTVCLARSNCQTVSNCVSVCVNALTPNQNFHRSCCQTNQVWLTTAIISLLK